MAHSEFKNAPPVFGWAIAVAAGALMFGVSLVALGIGAIGSVAIGVVVALIVGLIFTLAEGAPKPTSAPQAMSDAATPATSAAPAPGTATTQAGDATMGAAVGAAAASAATTTTESPAANSIATDADTKVTASPTAEAPTMADASADAAAPEPVQPKGLDAPVGDKDDLKRISGVGPVLEGKLNGLGFYHFWQIARWTRAEVDWVDSYLSFKGRIDRDDWISQATKLAADSPSKPPA